MQDHMQREEQPYLNLIIDSTLPTPKDTEGYKYFKRSTTYTVDTCAYVNLALEIGMALQM